MAALRKLFLPLLLLAPLHAQQIQDPANLTGEHVAPQSPADTLPINHGAAALQQLLQKLRTRSSMLLVVAHPDDEDGGFLTYESRGQGARVGMLTLNRGEGGQNLMTADFDDALGLIRTQELLAADRYMGVDQFFGTEVDFGFSKTKEETLQKWTHERVLYDAVRVIRLYRPLIIASVFVGGPTDGHGQHQVAGEIAQEAFVAAADPKIFPEMGLPPWAPLKVYARTPFARVTNGTMHDYATGKDMPVLFHNYVTGQDIDHAPAATVQIHEGEKSTQLGMDGDTYQQFARKGLALQKSQNGGLGRGPGGGGVADSAYTLMASRVACISAPTGCPIHSDSGMSGSGTPATEQTPFDDIDTSLPGIASLALTSPIPLRSALEAIDKDIAEAQRHFDPAHVELAAPPLRDALRKLDGLISVMNESQFGQENAKFNLLHELRIKRVQLNNALVLALGLDFRASTPLPSFDSTRPSVEVLTHFSTLTGEQLNCRIVSVGPTLEDPSKLTACGKDAAPPAISGNAIGRLIGGHFRTRPLTRPYFSRPSLEQPFYNISDPNLRNAPATPSQAVRYQYDSEGVSLELAAVVERTPAPGSPKTSPQAVDVIPPVSVSVSPTFGIVTPAETTLSVTASVHAGGTQYGKFRFPAPAGWRVAPRISNWSIDHPPAPTTSTANTNRIPLTLTVPPAQPNAPKSSSVTATATFEGNSYSESFRPVGYPGLTYTNMYTPATYKATAVDLTTAPNLHIAYLPGTGDDVPAFLPSLGVTPTILSTKDLTPDTLKSFDEVILGVRAYAAHPELAGAGSKPLLDFASAGGVVIVQYNNGHYGDAEAPYPITTPQSSGDHAHDVVVEAQPVTILQPSAPLLSWPNKITSADFHNWVAEYGHSFAGTWSPRYEPLLEVHDPDQDEQKGSLLVAPVGKGAYIYCALALYRQLPEGVPGAYRLFANLLSYAKNPTR